MIRSAIIIIALVLAVGRLTARRSRSGFLFPPVLPVTIREDSQGDGKFGAKRGSRSHQGVDLLVFEGQPIYTPIEGIVNRVSYPYANDSRYSGLEITGTGTYEGYTVKIFYLAPGAIGKAVKQGDSVGFAQSISKKYGGGMQDHIHLELRHQGELMDPWPLLQV
ncbi:MAG: M23 family metallopeptidase [Bacteroidia bacterium]|nr:M23 family metallopeptidase [Bacteroidia bacterium]